MPGTDRTRRAGGRGAPSETRKAQAPPRLLVVAISGSLRVGNLTRRSLEIALRGAASEGARTELLDLSAMELPFCDERRDEGSYPPDVARLRRAVGRAHGILLGSPEYHGSMSGALKNALDLLGFAQLEEKMVGLVAVAGGSQSATGTLAHMRTVCRHLHAWVVPRQVSISRIGDAFTSRGAPQGPGARGEAARGGTGRRPLRGAALRDPRAPGALTPARRARGARSASRPPACGSAPRLSGRIPGMIRVPRTGPVDGRGSRA